MRVAIIGWAQVGHKERIVDRSPSELVLEVVNKALEHACVEHKDVDFVVQSSDDIVDGRSISNVWTTESSGAFLKEESKVEEDGAFAAIYALSKILSGFARIAVVVAYGKISESSLQEYSSSICEPFYLRPLGVEMFTLGALQCSLFLKKNFLKEEDLAYIVVKSRRNGVQNQFATLKRPITLDEVLESEYVFRPLRETMIPTAADGAAAIVMASEDVALRSPSKVWIEGVGFSQGHYYPGYQDISRITSMRKAAQQAYKTSAIKNPKREIDFIEISEIFPHVELMALEELGIGTAKRLAKFVREGAFAKNGRFPINPSGGLLCSYIVMAAGLIRMIEVARRLSGEVQDIEREVKRALAHGCSGNLHQSNVIWVLARDK